MLIMVDYFHHTADLPSAVIFQSYHRRAGFSRHHLSLPARLNTDFNGNGLIFCFGSGKNGRQKTKEQYTRQCGGGPLPPREPP